MRRCWIALLVVLNLRYAETSLLRHLLHYFALQRWLVFSMGFSQSSSRNSFNPSTSLVPVPSPQVIVPLSTLTSLVPVSAASASSSSASGKSSLPPLLPTPNVPPLRTVKRMSVAEMQLRREKKLYFTCDAPYSWSHRCPNKHYMILQIEDDEEGKPPTVELPPELSASDPPASEPPPRHLSMNALSGEHAVGTIRFTGVIQGVEVQVLLDGGSSDNFIQPRVVRTLKLAVEPMTPFKVLVGNGHVLTRFSMVRNIPMLIQGHEIQISAHVLDMTGADIILGAQWLATLGPHIAYYSTATIKFYCAGQFITLHGEPKPIAKMAQFHHLRRLTNIDAIFEYFAIQPQYVDTRASRAPISDDLPTDLKQLLQNFSVVFDVPHGLPPQRSHDHALMNTVFQPYLRKFVLVFFDDILVYSSDWALHLQHLEQVLRLLAQHQLYAKLSKCVFGQSRIEYLGHFVSAKGVEMDPAKVQTKFHWSDEATTAFNALKTAVTSAPVLVLPDFSKPFTIETDASGLGIGAVLSQEGRPIAFFSKKMSNRMQQRYAYAHEIRRALSRSCFVASSSPVFNILDDVRRALPQDATTARLLSQCVDNTVVDPRYTLTDGILYWKGRIVVHANASTLKHSILHDHIANIPCIFVATGNWDFDILLKRCVNSASDMNIPLPLLTTAYGPVISPKAILQRRDIQIGNQWETQLLVAWDDDSCPTWETLTDFQQSYPTFDLVDKVTFNGGGNVMLPDQKQPVMDGKAQVQQASPNVEGPSENLMRRSVRMKKPTWKCIG
ncbi:Ty3/gypsy retrotransposon protein [Senna tora]|uniref:Ty3/gypsy retrotransposon protein n=1 Tax=Senna tora TaxID=362788 RepID=A0A834X702_9FABA|nr:Ty3/gypsy retrotransposon protein [Senna tora]